MNLFIPIILIIISVGTFFTYIDGKFQSVKKLKSEVDKYERKIDNADAIKIMHEKLSNKRNDLLKTNKLDRLNKLLPNHINNIELIVDIDRIARENSIIIRDINLVEESGGRNQNRNNGVIEISNEKKYNSTNMSFSFVSNYSNFKNFLDNLRKSLRLLDVVSISISGQRGEDGQINDNFEYNVKIRTYWLENK